MGELLGLFDKKPLTNREKEVYRTLRTNLEFTGIENRAIVVTSRLANDGKTTISYYLSSALAESGKNTLFIDADLRKSVFAYRMQMEGNPKGLSHYLSGKENWQDVVYPTNYKNLSVMPTGVFPSNPTELLAKPRFKQAIDEMKEVYDYVIVDAPPVGLVIDAAVIARCCDASMLVLASDQSSRNDVKRLISQLKAANPNFLGVVLNKVETKKHGYYGKYGSYGSYGYY
ncbi:MAG: CpsD/CapB family tyrosine-protein kinase [Lachnospiraceae bacterium]|nr:CpsD/CapB family tyrosine-protein kinase [Lachnospiraceae bacterium]